MTIHIIFALVCAILAIGYGVWASRSVLASSPGNARMQEIAAAIQEGADIVRVGQAIFGPRPTEDAAYWPGLFPDAAKVPAKS